MVIAKIAKGAKALTKRVKVRKVTGKPRGKRVINTRPKFVDKVGKKIGSKIRKKSATGDYFVRKKPLGPYLGYGSQKELDAVRWNQRGQRRVMLAQDRQTRIHKLIRKDKKVLPPYAFKKFTTKRKLSLPTSSFFIGQFGDTVKFLPVTQTKSGIKKRFGDLKRTASERRLVRNTALTPFEGTKSGFFIALGTRRKAWGVVRDDGKTTLLRMQSQPNKSIKRTEIQLKRPTNDQLLYLGLGGGGAAVLATRDWSTLVPYIDDVEAPKRKVGRR